MANNNKRPDHIKACPRTPAPNLSKALVEPDRCNQILDLLNSIQAIFFFSPCPLKAMAVVIKVYHHHTAGVIYQSIYERRIDEDSYSDMHNCGLSHAMTRAIVYRTISQLPELTCLSQSLLSDIVSHNWIVTVSRPCFASTHSKAGHCCHRIFLCTRNRYGVILNISQKEAGKHPFDVLHFDILGRLNRITTFHPPILPNMVKVFSKNSVNSHVCWALYILWLCASLRPIIHLFHQIEMFVTVGIAAVPLWLLVSEQVFPLLQRLTMSKLDLFQLQSLGLLAVFFIFLSTGKP